MVMCAFRSTLYPFVPYGCYCGFGGYGIPMDPIDTCCQAHDECYGNVLSQCYNRTGFLYLWPYFWSCPKVSEGQITTKSGKFPKCGDNSDNPCGKALCECDQKIVECWTKISKEPPSLRLKCNQTKTTTPVPNAPAPVPNKPSRSDKECNDQSSKDSQKILDAMNKFRKELGEGKFLTKDSKFPIGKEIYKMRWNCTLQALAEQKVRECNFNLTGEDSQKIGEATHVEYKISNEPVHDALKEWTKRVREFYEGNVNLSTKQFFSALDDFAQVASGLTTDVGCATNNKCEIDYGDGEIEGIQ
ncbi:unnamed protein product [Dracunculus medinensis]|uniref:Phospholipase A2 n=1 Tax=Dracunculus medinensis TaxID=318479 RepID=A0A0N4UPR2_DRAME|nr:unnamed protein product [Dracunculus medinensis]